MAYTDISWDEALAPSGPAEAAQNRGKLIAQEARRAKTYTDIGWGEVSPGMAVAAPPKPPEAGISAGDFGKSFAAGAASGAGAIAQGGGELLARGINMVGERLGFDPQARAVNPLQGWINDILDSRTSAAKKAEANTQISGELLKPETWDFGKDPSVSGIALQGMNALGQFAPNLGLALVTAGMSVPTQLAVGATVGGIQALGGSLDQEREAIKGMKHEDLLAGSKLYAELIAKGVPQATAKDAVAEAAAIGGGIGNAIPSAAEGAFENFLIGALTKGRLKIPSLGGGIAGRMVTGAVGGAAMGGAEEAVEQAGQNIGSNIAIGGNRPIGQDTLQNFVMGALAEGAAGTGFGAMPSGRPEPQPAATPPAGTPVTPPPSVAPAPSTGPTEPVLSLPPAQQPVKVVFPDGSVLNGPQELEQYLQQFPEQERVAKRAELLGMGEQPANTVPEQSTIPEPDAEAGRQILAQMERMDDEKRLADVATLTRQIEALAKGPDTPMAQALRAGFEKRLAALGAKTEPPPVQPAEPVPDSPFAVEPVPEPVPVVRPPKSKVAAPVAAQTPVQAATKAVEAIAPKKAEIAPEPAPIKPKPIEEPSPAPIRPPSKRWTPDPGAVPGEIALYLDVANDNFDTAKAGIIEREQEGGGVLYEVRLNDNTDVGSWPTVEQAAKAAESRVKPPAETRVQKIAKEIAKKPTELGGKRDFAQDIEQSEKPPSANRGQRIAREVSRRPGTTFLAAIHKAGGLSSVFAQEFGGDGAMVLNRRLPGLYRKTGMSDDGLLEWARENGYLTRAQIEAAANRPGGAPELAKDLVRRAMRDEEVTQIGSEEDQFAADRERRAEDAEAQALADSAGDAPDNWSTLTDEEKDAHLDRLFGETPQGVSNSQEAREEDTAQALGSEREPGQDDEEVARPAPAKRYEYGLTLRPVSFSTVPAGFIEFGKNDKYPHGTVIYGKPLPRKDIEHFDLEPLDPRDPINMRKRRDAIAAKIEEILLRDGAVKGAFPSDHVYLLTETTSGDKPLRVTTFLPDGTPSGHREYDSINGEGTLLDNAVSEFLDKDIVITGLEAPRPVLELSAPTPEELKAREEAVKAADAERARAVAAKERADREAANKKETKRREEQVRKERADKAREEFKLGQAAPAKEVSKDEAAGQGDVFAGKPESKGARIAREVAEAKKAAQAKRAEENAITERQAKELEEMQKNGEAPKMARSSSAPSAGITSANLRKALSDAFGDKAANRLMDTGIIVPVKTQAAIPEHVVPYLREGDTVYGYYDPKTGRTYAVLENLSADQVRGLALHEVGVHYGMQRMLGDAKYEQIMRRIEAMRASGNKAAIEAHKQAREEAVSRDQIPEETLAYLVMNHPEMGVVKTFIAQVKAFLFREFGIGAKYLTDADMAMLANAAVIKAGMHGKRPGELRALFQPSEPEFARNLAAAQQTHFRTAARSIVDKIDNVLNPLGTLPEQNKYLIDRGLAQGRIEKANDAASELKAFFIKADEVGATQAIYDYLTNAGATTDAIPQAFREGAAKVKSDIGKVGDQLVAEGMISQEARDEYRDAYLPRLYLKHLLSESEWKALGSGKLPSDMGYRLKRNKNLDADYRKVILGEVTDPGFLAAMALTKPVRDMALLDWLNTISMNDNWVMPGATVDFTSTVTGKQMRVTPFWLQTEAARLRKQAKHQAPEVAEKAEAEAKAMQEAADDAIDEHRDIFGADGKLDGTVQEFKQIPNTARYGRLRGLVVRKEIYDDLMGAHDFLPSDPGWFQNVFGYGGIGTTATQFWKMMKVVMNPPSQVRNFVSNGIAAQLFGGVPLRLLPGRVITVWRDILNKGKYYEIMRKHGVGVSTFSTQEVFRMKTDLLALEVRTRKMGALGRLHQLGKLAQLAIGHASNKAGDWYQFSEMLWKGVVIVDAMERQGKTENQAIKAAQDALFDYSLVSKSVRYARNAPIGIPFLTYTTKVLPRLLDVALHHPERFLPWVTLFYGFPMVVAQMLGVDDDDLDKLKKAMPTWLQDKGHALVLPNKDDQGRWQVADAGYMMPWTMWTELPKQLAKGEFGQAAQTIGFGGPLTDILTAIKTGKDPFTGRDIWQKGDPPGRQAAAIWNYAYNVAAPPFLTDRGLLSPNGLLDQAYGGKLVQAATGTTNKYGEPRSTATQALLYAFGVNVYAMTPEITRAQNVQAMTREMQDVRTRMRQQLQDRALSEAQRKAIATEYAQEIVRRSEKLKDYLKESQINPRLATAGR